MRQISIWFFSHLELPDLKSEKTVHLDLKKKSDFSGVNQMQYLIALSTTYTLEEIFTFLGNEI